MIETKNTSNLSLIWIKQVLISLMQPQIKYSDEFVDRKLTLEGKQPQKIERQADKDFRKKVQDFRFPFSCIGRIETGKQTEKNCVGTGFLIASNLVLTCAHNFIEEKNFPKTVKFYPSINRSSNEEDGISITSPIYYDRLYEEVKGEQQKAKIDLAILKLQKSIGNQHGYLGLDFSNQNIKVDDYFRMYGYSVLEHKANEKLCYELLESPGICTEVNDDFISYQEATGCGQSGGPIIIEKDGKYFAVGVHLYSIESRKKKNIVKNGANHLTSTKLQMFQKWLSKFFEEMYEANLTWHSPEDTLKLLTDKQKMKNVQDLNFEFCCLNDPHLENFPKTRFQMIKRTDLSGNQISNEGIKYLKVFPNLKTLILFKNQLKEGSICQLIKIGLHSLEILDLGLNDIGDDEGFSGLKDFKLLKTLKIPSIGLTNLGLKRMVLPERLKAIILSDNSIGNDTLLLLSQWGKQLTEIDISNNNMNDEGMLRAKRCEFPLLRKLTLFGNKLSGGCRNSFPMMSSLNWLDLRENQIEQKGLEGIGAYLKLKIIRNGILCA